LNVMPNVSCQLLGFLVNITINVCMRVRLHNDDRIYCIES
jgi:hypothetical protein